MSWLPGVHVAPNIQGDPALYEIENRALDPAGRITAAMASIAPWDDRVVLDLGSGTAFWAQTFQPAARHVVCVEPHGPSRALATARIARAGWTTVDSLVGSAAWIPLRDGSVDLVHARFAYFFGPGCEPGLAEVERVLAPGGTCIVIDNDLRAGTFAGWLAEVYPRDIDAVEAFWADQGFTKTVVRSCWRFERRSDLEAVVALEFGEHAERLLRGHEGLEVDYSFALYHRRY